MSCQHFLCIDCCRESAQNILYIASLFLLLNCKIYNVLQDFVAGNGVIVCSFTKGLLRLGPTYGVTFVAPNGKQLQIIAQLISEGKVKVILDRNFALEEAQ